MAVVNLVNQPVASIFQLDLVAIRYAGESGRLDMGMIKPISQFLLELFTDSAIEFLPLLQGGDFEFEAIAHPERP